MVFAIVLAVVGIWSSKKKPWKGGNDRMWHNGTNGLTVGIGYVVSRDGIQWTRVINAPVSISGPGWTGLADSPAVIVRPAGGYEMWFSNGLLGGSIGHASSSDGIAWTGATTVLQSGPPGSWDEGGVGHQRRRRLLGHLVHGRS